jgi:primase-polymerase (primpol)-like protein/biotin operon repressor
MTPPRPEALEVRPRNIPDGLKAVAGWVTWSWWWDGKRWTKPPRNIDGVRIDITNPDNWCDFTTALQAYQRGQFDGIGFSLGAMDSLGGVDLDHCIQGGKIEPWALEIIEELGSYAEISPSGTGVRVFGLTPRVVEGRKKDNIEMYVDGRYLTVTGCRLDNSASDLVDFDEAFGAVYDRVFPDSPESEDFDPTTDRGEVGEDLAERFQAFCEDDPTFKDRFNSPAAVGDRSGAEFHLCAKLWEAGFTFDEIWQLMDSSPQTKWRSREDAYKERTIRKAITAARSSEKDRGCGATAADKARVFIEKTVKEALKEDPRKLKDRAVLAALLTLREKDPLEFDLLTDELKGAGVVRLPTLKKMIDGEERRQADERARCGEEGGGVPDWLAPEVLEKAEAIMREGDPLQFLIFQSQRSHVGDINYQKVVLLSVAASNSLTSQGIHPGGTGDKGSGKTDAMKAVFHLLPPAPWKKSGSLSSLAPFYMGLPPGTIFYSDDVVWDLVGPVFRQATGSYQDGTIHNTLSKDREYRPLTIPPRFTWWLTSVEATHKEQENDRQYPISTDPRDEHKRIVSKEIGQRRARKERRLDVDEGVLVARAIIWLIKSHDPFKVLIPQAAKAEWSLFRDFRGQERFWDTVEAFAILRYMQRDEDPEGWLIATMEDIEAAKALFKADNLAHATKLTKAETALLGVMLDGGEFSQADLARALGISQQAVSDRLRAIMGRTKYITSDRGQGGRVLYTINAGKEIDPSLWSDFEMVRIEGDEKPTTEEVTTLLQPPYNPLTGIPTTIKIDSSRRIPVSLQPKKGGESGGDLLGEDPKKSDEKHISLDDRVEKVVNPTNRQRPPLVEGCNRGCKDHVTEVVNPLVDEKSPSGGGCKPPGGEVVTVGEDSGHTASEKDSTASGGRVPPPPGSPAGDGDGVHGVHGGGRPLTLTLDENIEKRERGEEREKREGKDRKSPPPSPPQPQDDGFGGVHGVHGGDTEAVAGEIPEPSDDYQSIAANLEEDRRRQAEEAERTATPPPKPKCDEGRAPTSEEAEVLADVAGRILENWPGLPEMLLWEKARGKLGSRLPLVVVRYWLSESGYIETGEKYGGGAIWNLPTSEEAVL